MKRTVCLFVILSVLILLVGCRQQSVSLDTTSPTEVTTPTQGNLSDDDLVKLVAQQLNVPENGAIQHLIEDVSSDNKKAAHKYICFYEDDLLVASAVVDPENGALVQDIYKYDPTNMNFYRYFQDEYFARNVALVMGKIPHEAVTEEELASFSGSVTASGQVESLAGIGYLKSLTELVVAKCYVKELPNEIAQCKKLVRLDLLKAFELQWLPENIGELENLEYIRADITLLESIPESIGELKKLKYLNVSSTKITSIPESIGSCESLIFLDLHSTDIAEIPDSITKLENLKSLDLGHTKITALPENIGELSELVRLDLFGLDLRMLPLSAKNLTKLEYLNVYDNYNLDEEYKQWFPNKCYECTNDPQNNEDWYTGI